MEYTTTAWEYHPYAWEYHTSVSIKAGISYTSLDKKSPSNLEYQGYVFSTGGVLRTRVHWLTVNEIV